MMRKYQVRFGGGLLEKERKLPRQLPTLWQWHGKKFRNPKDLLSPETSLRYAARLLRQNSVATHSWMKAALLYHSGDKIRQSIYRKRLIQYLIKGRAA